MAAPPVIASATSAQSPTRGWTHVHVVFGLAAAWLGWAAAPAVAFRDAGELGLAGVALGVPHPTGFAFDVLFLRAAAYLPLGHLAFRQNLATALFGALALALLAALTARLLRRMGVSDAWVRAFAGALAAAGLLGWQTFWASAVAVEVYVSALALLLAAGLCLLHGGRMAGLLVPLCGLAMGTHVTVGLYGLVLLAAVWLSRPRGHRLRFLLARAPAGVATALVVAYLPLASLRDPPLDWGNPETPARLLSHLTAARIRLAFSERMASGEGGASVELLQQLGELGWLVGGLAAVGMALGLRRARPASLLLLTLLVADLAYAAVINPMGVVDRQVGHLAGALVCVLAGIGGGCMLARLRSRLAQLAGRTTAAALSALLLAPGRAAFSSDYGADELYGGGGGLSRLPNRAVLIGWSDSQVAAGLFAHHAEGARPDIAIAPAQHLWDAQYQRTLAPLALAHGPVDDLDLAKAAVAERIALGLCEPGARPVLWESPAPLRRVGRGALAQLWPGLPYFALAGPALAAEAWPRELDALLEARVPEPAAVALDTRRGWARVYRLAGELLLTRVQERVVPQSIGLPAELAVSEALFGRALSLDPDMGAAWLGLGVLLASEGRFEAAFGATRRVLSLDPDNATAWANLIRFGLAAGRADLARGWLAEVERLGLVDPRFAELKAEVVRKAAAP